MTDPARVACTCAILAAAACTHATPNTWHEGQPHVARGSSAPAAAAPNLDAPDELSEDQVRAALAALGDQAPAGALALRAARLAHHRGDDALARADLARTATAADAASVQAAAAALASELAAHPIAPATIAVLLPLTGRFAAVGTELRAAIELAPADGTTWLFLDTRGEPDGATAAVAQAEVGGGVGVLGPGPVAVGPSAQAVRQVAAAGEPLGGLDRAALLEQSACALVPRFDDPAQGGPGEPFGVGRAAGPGHLRPPGGVGRG